MSSSSAEEAELTIYVDGSCQDNQNVTSDTPAGWGVVIVTGDNRRGTGSGEIVTEIHGRVITSEGSELFLGAEVGSNNTAELSAIAHALRWLLTNPSDSAVTIRGDSQYALEISKGNWKAKANKILAAKNQSLWNEVSAQRQLTGSWIRAHRGHKWNERADHLAFRAMQSETPLPLEFWKPGKR